MVEVEVPKKKEAFIKKEYNFSIKPIGILKVIFVILLITGAFFLGRLTMDTNITTSEGSGITAAVVANSEPEEVQEELTGTFKLIPDKPEPVEEEPITEEPAQEVVEEEVKEESNNENLGPMVTKYTKVSLAINNVNKNWMDTWGKITQVEYTIRNNEDGPIKVHHFVLNVEGYDDFDKKIPIPLSSQIIKPGESSKRIVNVPKGFAYSPSTAGKLDKVGITLRLFDESEKLVTGGSTFANLEG
jgi:hypothetical protein